MKRLNTWFVSLPIFAVLGMGVASVRAEQPNPARDLASTGRTPLVAMATVGPKSSTAGMAADEVRFLAMLNQERSSRGLAPLVQDAELAEVARLHSQEMAAKGYFSHESPTPGLRRPMDRYRNHVRTAPEYLLVGENLFYCSAPGVERGHKALMASEGHRKNMLDSRYERVGIGTYLAPDGQYWVTQMFLKRRD